MEWNGMYLQVGPFLTSIYADAEGKMSKSAKYMKRKLNYRVKIKKLCDFPLYIPGFAIHSSGCYKLGCMCVCDGVNFILFSKSTRNHWKIAHTKLIMKFHIKRHWYGKIQ